MDYISLLSQQLGISVFWIVTILIWSMIWKLLALWKSARLNQPIWFVVLAFVNLLGLLEILYIFVFSKMGRKSRREPQVKKSSRRKSKRR